MRWNSRLTRGIAAAIAAAAVVLTLGTGWDAASGAAAPPTPPLPTATTPTTAPPTTTTTSPSGHYGGGGSAPDAPASDSPSQPGAAGPSSAPDSPAVAAMKAEAASIHRTPPSSTLPLLTALAPLEQVGLTQVQEALVGFGEFPVAGPAYYTDDWLEFRPGPPPGLHPGIDIQAAESTPILAPASGTLSYNYSDPNGYGLVALVTQPDKTLFLMAHMSATVRGLASGMQVQAGQVIGFVGATGNATGPHVHFEVHPFGGPGIDGKPYLDNALTQALAAAPSVVAEFSGHDTTDASTAAVTVPAALPVVPTHSLPADLVSHRGSTDPSWKAAVRGVAVVAVIATLVLSGHQIRRRRRRHGSRTAG